MVLWVVECAFAPDEFSSASSSAGLEVWGKDAPTSNPNPPASSYITNYPRIINLLFVVFNYIVVGRVEKIAVVKLSAKLTPFAPLCL